MNFLCIGSGASYWLFVLNTIYIQSSALTGSFLTKKNINIIIKEKLDLLRISLEGTNKESYEIKRRGGKFERLINNLEYLKYAIEERKSKLYVQMRATLGPDDHNKKYYEDFLLLWGKYADEINFGSILTQQGQMLNDDTKKHLSGRRKVCNFPFDGLTLNCDGSVGFCCTDYDRKIKIGSFPDNSLYDLWNSKRLNNTREYFLKRSFAKLPDICQNCEETYLVDSNIGCFVDTIYPKKDLPKQLDNIVF